MSETSLEQNEKVKKPVTVRAIPQSDIDLGTVALNVAEKWLENENITLVYTTSEAFSQIATDYHATINKKKSVSGSRPQITKALEVCEKKMNDALPYVKIYLNEKYKIENAPSYYPAFGIEFTSGAHRLANDQNGRIASLKLMVDAIDEHGFANKEYGTTFWKEVLVEYEALVKEAGKKDGEVSNKVGDKNVLKKSLKTTLNSIIYIIKGNYPETYKQELRAWGFQKEKY